MPKGIKFEGTEEEKIEARKAYKKKWNYENREKIAARKKKQWAEKAKDPEFREKRRKLATIRNEMIRNDSEKRKHRNKIMNESNKKRLNDPIIGPKLKKKIREYQKSPKNREKNNYSSILKRYDYNKEVAEVIYLCNRIRREQNKSDRRRSCKRKTEINRN